MVARKEQSLFYSPLATFFCYPDLSFSAAKLLAPSPSLSFSPVLLTDGYTVHIHAFFEPALLVGNLDIVAAHLSLAHESVGCEGPVFEPVRPVPLAGLIMPLVPELYCYLKGSTLAVIRQDCDTRYIGVVVQRL